MPLDIPERDRRRLELLARLSPRDLSSLHGALAETKPVLSPVEFAASVAGRTKLDRAVATQVVRFLLSLYWVMTDEALAPETMVDEVVRNAKEGGIAEPQGGWEIFRKHLRKFLALDNTLGVAAKSLYIRTQYPSHFHSSRIMTDARPVFGSDPSLSPVAFVINHTLQISIHVDGDDKELFIALDGEDLVALRTTIDRAIAKEKSLSDTLLRTALPVLSSTSTTDTE